MRSLKKYEIHSSVIALAVCIISAILHTVSMLFFCDADAYFTVGAAMPIVSNTFLAVSIIAFAVCAFLFTDSKSRVKAPEGVAGYFALLPAAALLIHSAQLVSTALASTSVLSIVKLMFAIVSAIFFIMIAFSKEYTTVTALCGTGFIIWLGICWLNSYNDLFIPMNSPEKLFFHFGCIGAALLVVGELRSMYDISKPKLYRFSLWSAQLLLLAASLPSVIEFFTKSSKSSVFYESLVLFCIALYAIARSISFMITSYRAKKEEAASEE